MNLLLSLLAAAALLALATWAHFAFWGWKLAASPLEDERIVATTADGWRLHLGRRRPRAAPRPIPVLLVHGIAMNRQIFAFGVPSHSLVEVLSAEGFDCFALDLRGHGESRQAPPGYHHQWTLDDYLALDLPAALDAVALATGQRRVLWVGHSQGALLGLVAAQKYPERIAGVVALAPPIRLPHEPAADRFFPQLASWRLFRPLARLVAPFSGWWQPRRAGLSIQLRNMDRHIYRRLLMNAIEELPPGVVHHFLTLVAEDRLGSLDGREDWREGLAACRQPALFVGAPLDGLAPVSSVEEGYRRWGGEKTLLVAAPDVGHGDLVLGRRAPTELFPVVRDWLEAHSPPA